VYLVNCIVYHVEVASKSNHMIFMKLMVTDFDLKSMKNLGEI
jgi:hypothetical protein